MNHEETLITQSDLEVEQMETEILHQDQLNTMYDKLGYIYDQVIGSYRKGEQIIYNPNICKRMTKNIFIEWVIENNPELKI